MANETNTTTLNDLVPEIIQEAMFQAEERSIMQGLVRTFSVPLGNGKTVDVPIYGASTAVTVAEGTDLANTAISTDVATLTVGEVGLMATVTDMARDISTDDVIVSVGRLFGEAIARKQDQDLTALFAGFGTALGDGTTAMTAAKIFEAVAKLKALGLDPSGIACVLNPEIAYDLNSSMTNTFAGLASDTANEAMRQGYVGTLSGIPVYETANVISTAGDSVGGVFHKDALGLASLRGISIEPQRDASLRATELVGTAVYGVGELRDTYGIGMNFDSSIAS